MAWNRRSRSQEALSPGYLEAVYHLYSMEKKHGPVMLRLRTENRTDRVHLPSLTPVWRSAEFQEREIFDLYGIIFDGHPDLRRILMWDEFEDHPMRKDYVEPDDYEYEPTAHDDVLAKAKQHAAAIQNHDEHDHSAGRGRDARRTLLLTAVRTNCWKSRWDRIIRPRMASSAWTSCSMANAS